MDDVYLVLKELRDDLLLPLDTLLSQAKGGTARNYAQAKELVKAGNEAEITDQASLDKAADLLGQVKGFQKAFEAARKETVDPLNAVVKEINEASYEVFHPTKKLGLLAEAEKALKDKIGAYQKAEEDRQRQEAIRLQEQEMHHAHEEGREPARLPLAQPQAPKAKGVHTAKRWVFRVLDLGLLREEYVEPASGQSVHGHRGHRGNRYPREGDMNGSWVEVLSFAVNGVPKPRAKFKATKMGKVYDTGSADGWKERVFITVRQIWGGKPPLEGPLSVAIDFYLPRPKRLYRKKDPDGPMWHGEPHNNDRDNLEKTTLDALQFSGVMIGDGQVCTGLVQKFYTKKGGSSGAMIKVSKWEAMADD
jgi:Holliday junction resolvase RusA-like endonuclease